VPVGHDKTPDVLHLTRFPELPPPFRGASALSAEQLSAWWDRLGSANEFRRRYAVQVFAARPEQALALIAERVNPETAKRRAMVLDLIGVLNDDRYENRDKAQAELQPLARRFEPLLAAAVQRAGPGEVRNRLTHLLSARHQLAPDASRTELSAVEVLEAIGTAEAKELLATLAGGANGSRVTAAAKSAHARLTKAGR
jgi:hypothetical protein